MFGSKFKIFVTTAQITGPVGSNLGVMFPPKFTSALGSLAIVNLDILPSLNLACMYEFNYINKVYVTTLAPIAMSVVLFLGMLIMKGGNVKKAGSAAATPFLAFTFIIFISTSSAVFGYFKCDEFIDIGDSFIEGDYSISCKGDEYKRNQVFAAIMTILYPIGIPAMYFILLFRKRRTLLIPKEDRTDEERKAVAHLKFIADAYKPEFWYFEVIECIRRILLSAGLVFITPGSPTQGIFATIVSYLSTLLYLGCQQFPDPSVNRLGVMAQVQLFFTFLSALMVKMDISTMSNYDAAIFDNMLVALLFICPAMLLLDPIIRIFSLKIQGGTALQQQDANPTDATGIMISPSKDRAAEKV